MRNLQIVLLLLTSLTVRVAAASALSASYSTWTLNDDGVSAQIMLPVDEARRLVGADMPVITVAKLQDYLLRHEKVSAGGMDCPAIDQGYDLGRVNPLWSGTGWFGFEMVFRCKSDAARVLDHSALFERVPDHVHFARLQRGSEFVEKAFTAAHHTWVVPVSGLPRASGFAEFVPLGARHLLASGDRWCFLFGILLLVRGWRQGALLIGALAAGELVAAALCASQRFTPREPLPEALFGCLVLWIAWTVAGPSAAHRSRMAAGALLLPAAVALATKRGLAALLLAGAGLLSASLLALQSRSHQRSAWLVAAVLAGCLDGLTLPGAMQQLDLSAGVQLSLVLGFATGALGIAAITVVVWQALASWPPLKAWCVRHWALFQDVSVTVLGGLGAYWSVSRAFA